MAGGDGAWDSCKSPGGCLQPHLATWRASCSASGTAASAPHTWGSPKNSSKTPWGNGRRRGQGLPAQAEAALSSPLGQTRSSPVHPNSSKCTAVMCRVGRTRLLLTRWYFSHKCRASSLWVPPRAARFIKQEDALSAIEKDLFLEMENAQKPISLLFFSLLICSFFWKCSSITLSKVLIKTSFCVLYKIESKKGNR